MKKVSYNIRAQLDIFVVEFVGYDGIKEIMKLIDEAMKINNNEIVTTCCQMLSNILAFKVGIEAMTKRARRYCERFLELADLNQSCKKQVIRIFYNIAKADMPDDADAQDIIDKATANYAIETNQQPYQCLIQGFMFEKAPDMAMSLLKFINEMLFKSQGDEKKQAKFLAKLEGLNIKEHMSTWYEKDNEDIKNQITAYQHLANDITKNTTYKLEVHK